MAFPTYTTSDTLDGTLDIELMHRQIDAVVSGLLAINRTGISFELVFGAPPSIGDQAQCDAVVAAHMSLEIVQDRLVNQIKAHRDEQRLAIDLQAEYPSGSGKLFSCSATSQNNWAKLATLDDQGDVAYPYTVRTYDERDSYDLINSTDREAATLAVAAVVMAERSVAESAIAQVLAATSVSDAEVAALGYLSS